MKTLRIDEIEPIPVVDGDLDWRPIRRTLGIGAFGINAYTANAGDLVVEEHDETGAGAGHHEELYVVVTGRATFTVDSESFDAPVGTLVFLDDPKERRAARAVEDGTTVLAIGGAGPAFSDLALGVQVRGHTGREGEPLCGRGAVDSGRARAPSR